MARWKKWARTGAMLTLGVAVLAVIYAVTIRPWQLHRGATKEEIERTLPGDDRVPNPKFAYTQAITIQAPPEAIWPWLVQIGYHRAGWYSHDWIHRLLGVAGSVDDDRRSANRVIPELQDLQVGDLIEIAPEMGFEVLEIEPNQFLLLGTEDGSWVWFLDPADTNTTRLIVRMRGTWPPGPGNALLFGIPNELGSLVMQPKTLRGIQQRAEGSGRETE
jgi:hypothetical protein